jgi:16S rRNA (adenine1518-N6/adenine1519-N6)-dimethyltransferase
MVQKEVAQRICAKPPDMNLLAVSVQFYANPEIVSYVSKKSFWPSPKVDSAIIKLKVKSEKLKIDKNLFFKIVRAGFSQPRKQLLNNLSKRLKLNKQRIKIWLGKNKIKPSRRAETLTLKNWVNLTQNYKNFI